MERDTVVFVRCGFIRGGFPGERIFIIRFPEGGELRGVAPVQYCYGNDRKPLGDKPPAGKEIKGQVVGVFLGRRDDDLARVHLPDGEIYEVENDQIYPVRTEAARHVPVKP